MANKERLQYYMTSEALITILINTIRHNRVNSQSLNIYDITGTIHTLIITIKHNRAYLQPLKYHMTVQGPYKPSSVIIRHHRAYIQPLKSYTISEIPHDRTGPIHTFIRSI